MAVVTNVEVDSHIIGHPCYKPIIRSISSPAGIPEYEKFVFSVAKQEGIDESQTFQVLDELKSNLYEGCALFLHELYQWEDAPIEKELLPKHLFDGGRIKSYSSCTSYYRKFQPNLNACLACRRSPMFANKYINEELQILHYMFESMEHCKRLEEEFLDGRTLLFLSVYDILLGQRSSVCCFLQINQWFYDFFFDHYPTIFTMFKTEKSVEEHLLVNFVDYVTTEKNIPAEFLSKEKFKEATFYAALKRIRSVSPISESELPGIIDEMIAWENERAAKITLAKTAEKESLSTFLPDYSVKKQLKSKKAAKKEAQSSKPEPIQLSFPDLENLINNFSLEEGFSDKLVLNEPSSVLAGAESKSESTGPDNTAQINFYNTKDKIICEDQDRYTYENPVNGLFDFIDELSPSAEEIVNNALEENKECDSDKVDVVLEEKVTEVAVPAADVRNNDEENSTKSVSNEDNPTSMGACDDNNVGDSAMQDESESQHRIEEPTFENGLAWKEISTPDVSASLMDIEFAVSEQELSLFSSFNGDLVELAILEDAAQKDGLMAVEVVACSGRKYVLIYVHSRRKYYKTDLSSQNDFDVISVLFRRNGIKKVCYQPYLLYSYCFEKGLRIKGVYALLTHHKYIYPSTTVMGIRDLLYFSVSVHSEDTKKELFHTSNLLYNCMRFYKTLYSIQTRSENRANLAKYVIETMEEWDQAVGYSYCLDGCMNNPNRLFVKRGPGQFEFNNSCYLKTKDQVLFNGYFATYEFSDTKNALAITRRFLCNMSKEGYFGNCNIQLVSVAKNRLVFYIEESEFDYLDSVIGVKLRKQAKQSGVNNLKLTVLYEYKKAEKGIDSVLTSSVI